MSFLLCQDSEITAIVGVYGFVEARLYLVVRKVDPSNIGISVVVYVRRGVRHDNPYVAIIIVPANKITDLHYDFP
jgi:hypothetical protein